MRWHSERPSTPGAGKFGTPVAKREASIAARTPLMSRPERVVPLFYIVCVVFARVCLCVCKCVQARVCTCLCVFHLKSAFTSTHAHLHTHEVYALLHP